MQARIHVCARPCGPLRSRSTVLCSVATKLRTPVAKGASDLERFKGSDVPLNLYGGKKPTFTGKVRLDIRYEALHPAWARSEPACAQ
jgi:hypothetical protein